MNCNYTYYVYTLCMRKCKRCFFQDHKIKRLLICPTTFYKISSICMLLSKWAVSNHGGTRQGTCACCNMFFSRLITMCVCDILQIRYGCTPWLQAWCLTWIHTHIIPCVHEFCPTTVEHESGQKIHNTQNNNTIQTNNLSSYLSLLHSFFDRINRGT
jgi:hypothetical protein